MAKVTVGIIMWMMELTRASICPPPPRRLLPPAGDCPAPPARPPWTSLGLCTHPPRWCRLPTAADFVEVDFPSCPTEKRKKGPRRTSVPLPTTWLLTWRRPVWSSRLMMRVQSCQCVPLLLLRTVRRRQVGHHDDRQRKKSGTFGLLTDRRSQFGGYSMSGVSRSMLLLLLVWNQFECNCVSGWMCVCVWSVQTAFVKWNEVGQKELNWVSERGKEAELPAECRPTDRHKKERKERKRRSVATTDEPSLHRTRTEHQLMLR